MKKILLTFAFISCISALSVTTTYAANPVTQAWVLDAINPLLSAADWNAVCSSGSPTSANGCYGNVSSAAFTKVSDHLGGFTRYANINPVSTANSVFIKAFFAGTNVPTYTTPAVIQINVINSAARCGLFTQVGLGLGLGGISTTNPASGSTSTKYVILHTPSLVAINNATSMDLYYNAESIGTGVDLLSTVVIPNPIYLVCAGYDTTDGSTATPINVTAV